MSCFGGGGAVVAACSALTSLRKVAKTSGGGTSVSVSDSESVPRMEIDTGDSAPVKQPARRMPLSEARGRPSAQRYAEGWCYPAFEVAMVEPGRLGKEA